jgi:lipoprotein-releasing system permease protein
MSLESSLARRFLFSKRRGRFLSAAAWIAVLGLGFGVGALWVAFSVLSGFQSEYRRAILGINAHVILQKADEIPDPLEVERQVLSAGPPEEVAGVVPFIYREGLAVSGPQVKGLVLKGVDFERYARLSKVDIRRVPAESAENPDRLPEIVLGKSLAEGLGLTRGVLRVLFPQGLKPEAMGVKNVKKFFVAGTFESGLHEYDATFALLDLETAQMFFQTEGKVSGLELWLRDADGAGVWGERLRERFDFPYAVMTWRELNENVFRALEMERLIFGIILGVLVSVSALNVVGTLAMLFLEKRGEVALLRALGLSWRRIRKVFLFDGLLIGCAGVAAGLVMGSGVLLFLDLWKPVALAPEVYFVSSVPVVWSGAVLAGVAAASLLVVLGASALTLARISRLNVVRSLLEA